MSNFIYNCLKGTALLEDIDDYVDQWHRGDSPDPIHRHLGMTRSEYDLWLVDPDVLPFIVDAHRQRRDVTDLIEEFHALPLAARAASPERARDLAKWLKRQGLWE